MLIKTYLDYQTLIKAMEKADIIVYDIETDGLNVRKNKIIGFGIATSPSNSFYLPLLVHSNGTLIDSGLNKQYVINVLNLMKLKKIICHNAYFDLETTRNALGIDLISALYCDTILLKHTVDEERPFGLKDVAAKLFGYHIKNEQTDLAAEVKANGGSKGEIWRGSVDLVSKYCEQDCKLTYRVYLHYMRKLEEENLESFFFQEEVMPLYRDVVFPMQRNGIPLDLEQVKRVQIDLMIDLKNLESKIQEAILPNLSLFTNWFLNKDYPPRRSGTFAQGVAGAFRLGFPKLKTGKYSITAKGMSTLPDSAYKSFLLGGDYLTSDEIDKVQQYLWKHEPERSEFMFNLLSKHHLKKLFFDTLGEEPVSRTPKGSPQVDDKFLDLMAKKYEWVELLRQFNKLTKILGTYVTRFLDEQENGIFYPTFLMHGTTSGRFSGDMQQLPRVKEEGELPPLVLKYSNAIRSFFIAGSGYKLVDADYASLEVVVFADDAGDEKLLNMIRNNEDFYSRVAIDTHPELAEYSAEKSSPMFLKTHKPELRQAAKVYGLGIRYGMRAFKLSKTLDIEQDEAELILDAYFRNYPNLKTRMDLIIASAKTLGFVESKAGRRRHYKQIKQVYETYGDNILDERWIRKQAQVKYEDGKVIPNSQYLYLKETSGKQKSAINNALNFPIQSMAASIVNQASIAIMKQFNELGLSAYIALNIHDEICIRCPEAEVDKVVGIMRHCMEQTLTLDAPLTAEPNVGNNYSEVK
jgi:DNA polymerase I-like protein with 3'-5' exonuclease and polymerase domains